jgi:hypothetical protein
VLFEGAIGLVPVESVLLTIEVKSKLTLTELKKAEASARELMAFEYAHGAQTNDGNPLQHAVERVHSAVFAFESDLQEDGRSEIQRYIEVCGESDPALRMFCVIGRGYWSFHRGQWCPAPNSYPLEEVVWFISAVLEINEGCRLPESNLVLVGIWWRGD